MLRAVYVIDVAAHVTVTHYSRLLFDHLSLYTPTKRHHHHHQLPPQPLHALRTVSYGHRKHEDIVV